MTGAGASRLPAGRKALFGLPAVRLLTPWDDPADRDLARRAQLEVFGTIAHALGANKRRDRVSPGAPWFRTGPMDGFQFLEEVFAGRRRWYRPKTLGHKTGLWALKTDVADLRQVPLQGRRSDKTR